MKIGILILLVSVNQSFAIDNNSQAPESQQPRTREISGKVTDTDGQPLIGVSIVIKGTTTGTITDMNGNFSLSIPFDAQSIEISYVGMKPQELSVDGLTTIDISMEEELIGMDEIIVVGYGTQRKANITGSVAMVTSDRIEDKAVSSVGHALQGVIPNLNIEIRGGRPGTTPDFNVRGYESITGGSPLILVDGVPRSANNINQNDIESITVLKDASAAAIYGARGAFGVILIQTKRAKEQDFSVNLHTRYSAEIPIWKLDPVLDPYVVMAEENKAQTRTSGSTVYEPWMVEAAQKWSEDPRPENAWVVKDGTLFWVGGGEDASWNQFLRKVVPTQDYNLDIQGGTQAAKYFASIGWEKEPGVIKPEFKDESHQRLNADLKVDLRINDWLSLKESVSYINRFHDAPHEYIPGKWDLFNRYGITRYAGGFPSTDIVNFPDVPGRDFSEYEGMWVDENHFVPYNIDGGRDKTSYNDYLFTQGMTINPLKNLEFRGDFTYHHYNRRREDVASHVDKFNGRFDSTVDLFGEMVTPGASATTYVINEYNQNNYYFLNALGEYELDNSNSRHYFKAMLGFNQEWNVNKSGTLQAYDMITPSIHSIAATVGDQYASSAESHLALRGVFSRINYVYAERYLFELSGRYDGTSRFPKEDRFGFFPSASAAWRISKESFMERFDFLSNLMIRGSYGELGNQGVGNYYPYIASMGVGRSWHLMEGNRLLYLTPAGLISPTLTWEKTQTSNIGIDVGLFNQRLILEFDKYTRKTLDMLMRITYPALLGTTAPQENGADLKNNGWELIARFRGRFNNDWSYNIDFNLADNKTVITKFDGNPTGAINNHYVGRVMGEIWGYETIGIFQTDEEVANAADQSQLGANWRAGDIQFTDLNDDGKINPGNNTLENPGDRKIIGNTTPRYMYGLNLDLNYKNFSLTVFFQGIGKRDWYPPAGSHTLFFPFSGSMIQNYEITDSWTEENRDAYFFAATRMSTKNTAAQTRYLQDASYLRLKNLVLRYEVPTAGALQSIGLARLQLYISGYNLTEWTKMHKTYDPEYLWNTVMYPLSRTFTLGARVSF